MQLVLSPPARSPAARDAPYAESTGGSEPEEASTPAAQLIRTDWSSTQGLRRSPKYQIHSMLGPLIVSSSTNDPMREPATLVVAPVVLTALWPFTEFPDGPLADVVYREDAYRREVVRAISQLSLPIASLKCATRPTDCLCALVAP